MIETRPLFKISAEVADPQITPDGPVGDRRFIPVTPTVSTGVAFGKDVHYPLPHDTAALIGVAIRIRPCSP